MTRRARDYYPTTPELAASVRWLLRLARERGAERSRSDESRRWWRRVAAELARPGWFDPAAGQGALVLWTSLRFAHVWDIDRRHGETLRGLADAEQLADRLLVRVGVDALARSEAWPVAPVAMNPPFSAAGAFLVRALSLSLAVYQMPVLCLARQSFIGEAAREDVVRRWGPPHVEVVCCWRPSFDGRGTDTQGCSWLLWLPGEQAETTARLAVYRSDLSVGAHWAAVHRSMVDLGASAARCEPLSLGLDGGVDAGAQSFRQRDAASGDAETTGTEVR